MLKEKMLCYLNWLDERGVVYPHKSQIQSSLSTIEHGENTASVTTTTTDAASPTKHSPQPLRGRKILWLDTQLPDHQELQTFTKLCLALKLEDNEFHFAVRGPTQDMGQLLESADEMEVKWMVCFSEKLAEMLCDNDIACIKGQWHESAYDFKVLPSPSIAEMMADPRQKIKLWQALNPLLHP